MPAMSATDLDPAAAGRQVQLIVDSDNVGGLELEEAHCFPHSLTGEVHIGKRLHQQHFLAVDLSFGNLCLEFSRPGGKRRQTLQGIDGHEADIVSVTRILRAGVA